MTLIPGIKQISQVGNDMYAQGAFPVGIGTTEVSYLADPADTRLLAGRDPVLEEVSVGMSGVETDMKYATGAQPLTVTDAMLGNLNYCQVQFSPKQDLNGYANPWPEGGGANQWDEEWENGWISSSGALIDSLATIRSKNFCQCLPNTTYYLYCGSATSPLFVRPSFYDAEKTFIVGTDWAANTAFTTPPNCYYFKISTQAAEGYEYGGVYKHDIAINYPSTVTTYSPYSNLCPISGTTDVNIYVAPAYDPAAAPEATVSLGAERFGGTADVVSGNGIETWKLINANEVTWSNTGTEGIYCTLPDKLMATGTAISDTFEARTYSSSNRVGWTDATPTRAEKLAIIAAGDVHILYNLNIPTPFTFPGANDITLQEGTNTIWADTNGMDISVTYVTKK